MNKAALTNKTHKIAKENGLPFNTVMTHFFLEAILIKLSVSNHANHFIFKGGMLLSNVLSLSQRTTIDMDFLIRDYPLEETDVWNLFEDITNSEVYPEVVCKILSIEPIRETHEYSGYRIKIQCKLENIRQVVIIDLSAGDPITPGPITYPYKSVYSTDITTITAYNLETILAEKFHTIINLGISNSRSKDFYDVYAIWKHKLSQMNINDLRMALINTFNYRKTSLDIDYMLEILDQIATDARMKSRWNVYQSRNNFAKGIEFEDTLQSCRTLIQTLFND